jgi:hypothetical protein
MSIIKSALVLCLSLLSIAAISAEATAGLVIKQKQPFKIIYPAKALPVEKTAASELAVYLEKTTGAKPQILAESASGDASGDAYIGQCAFTRQQKFYQKELKQEGFQVTVDNGKLFIYGNDQDGDPYSSSICTGTLFGVYDFIEKELGVAWLWPGELGEDIPSPREIALNDSSRLETPGFMIRSMKFGYMKYEPDQLKKDLSVWAKRMKMSWVPRAWFGHSWDYYIFRTGADKAHPEWLALVNGVRRKPHCCTSNKEFRDYVVEQCLTNKTNKQMSIVSISPSDGGGFCECDACRALDPKGTDYTKSIPNLSDRYWNYANYVAKEVKKRNSNLGVGMFAYTAYSNPPTNISKFEDNVYVSFTFSEAYFVKPEQKKRYYEMIDCWKSKGVKIVGREYWGMHYWLDLPYLFTRQIKDAMPYLYDRGLIAMYGESGINFATQGPNYFLTTQLMWNPHANADKIMERYYQGFGPAAAAIRKYYDCFEQSILDNQNKFQDFAYANLILAWPEIFPPQTIENAGKFLEEAVKAADGSKLYAERVKFVGIGYEYTKMMVELLGIYRELSRGGVHMNAFNPPENEKRNMDKTEKVKLLRRAVELGNERERILNENVNLPAVSRGLYMFTIDRKIRPWHKTVKDALAKEEASAAK